VPAGMGMAEAAALCETFFTVWTNVFMRGGLRGGERFLVHGGSSGIGTTAIQLARHFGARVFATAGSDEKCAACARLGAERAINYREEDFVEILRAEGGANLILDMVGGSYLPRNVKALADEGRLVQIAFLQGPKVELNFAQVMMRRLTITGSTLRPQSDAAKADIAGAARKGLAAAGRGAHRTGHGPGLRAGGCGGRPCADGKLQITSARLSYRFVRIVSSSRHGTVTSPRYLCVHAATGSTRRIVSPHSTSGIQGETT
jgi:hypothetical protein